MGTVDALREFRNHDIDDDIDIPIADLLAQPEIVTMMADLGLGSHPPDIPLLVVQAVHD